MSRPTYEIRADYDRDTIVVYQAYGPQIAKPAVEQQRFVKPFSFTRMTWIKPSFLWMMARSNWGNKAGQEHILKIRIKRTDWEYALSQAVLTHAEQRIYGNVENWRQQMNEALVNVQWDPERSVRGGNLEYRSIQVGISRHLIEAYATEWIVSIEDITPLVHKMYRFNQKGDFKHTKRLLPNERPYAVSDEIRQRLGMGV